MAFSRDTVGDQSPSERLVRESHLDVLSAFRPCGRDLVEFFNSTGWALHASWRAVPSPDAGRHSGTNLSDESASKWQQKSGTIKNSFGRQLNPSL